MEVIDRIKEIDTNSVLQINNNDDVLDLINHISADDVIKGFESSENDVYAIKKWDNYIVLFMKLTLKGDEGLIAFVSDDPIILIKFIFQSMPGDLVESILSSKITMQ